MREIEYLKQQANSLHEDISGLHYHGAPTEWIEQRRCELQGKLVAIYEAIDALEQVEKTSKKIRNVMIVIVAALAGLLLWTYFVKII